MPLSRTFPTLNAIVLTDTVVITVQITIALQHDANKQEFDLIYKNLPPGLLSKQPDRYHIYRQREQRQTLREQNHTQVPDGTLVYSTAFSVESIDSTVLATERRMDALEKARVSMHWLYAIWCFIGKCVGTST